MADDPARRLIEKLRNDPEHRRMMVKVEQEARRIRKKYADCDPVDLDDVEWQEWLTAHHVFERDRARGRRANHRHQMKMAARAARSTSSRTDG